jgi:uroporphyrinogen-III decarboxylase
MDFENAAVAMIDEDQQDAVKELYDKLADLYIKIIDKHIKYFGAEAFCVHDDWGSQMAPFFSPAVTKELLVPAMRKLTDHIHSKGAWADFHSCGHIEQQVPNMIAAGWDSWSGMAMNDTQGLYKKYGDKIIIGVVPDQFPPDTPEAEQRAAAKKFVDQFCSADKPCVVNMYGAAVLTPAYREELYKQSRIKLGGQ